MKSPRSEESIRINEAAEEGTGLPGQPTWRKVYVFVLISLVVYVGLLAVLTGVFAP